MEFICDNNKVMNLDLLRKCMCLQVERYKIRMTDMTELLSHDMLPSYDKAQLTLSLSRIIDWSLQELR